MAQMFRILGKRGRITIPFEIRQSVGFSYNDVLSFTEAPDGKAVIVKREKICDDCVAEKQRRKEAKDTITLFDFLNSLSDEQQKAAFLYRWSMQDAIAHNEVQDWRDSYRENCDCAKAIERAIAEHYHDNVLEDGTKDIINRYGFDRVNWVLANTLQEKSHDGRFSRDNKAWANDFFIPNDDMRWHFCVESHPGLTDIFINQARKAWQELDLFDRSHCADDADYTGKLLILKPSVLKDEFKTPDYQLFYAESGFGCSPTAFGRKVFGKFLKDGENTNFNRSDFLGAIKDACIPKWAAEKLAELESSDADESEEITMGGM